MSIPDEVRDRIIKDFPHLAHLLDHPDLAEFWDQVYEKTSTTGLTDNEFTHMFWNTQWFRNHSGSARQWDTLVSQDPMEAQRKRERKRIEVHNLASQWGIVLSAETLDDLTEQFLRWGFSDAEILASLSSQAGVSRIAPGSLRSTEDQIRGLATAYYQSMSGADIADLAREVMAQRMTLDNIETLFRDRAKQEYGHLSERLNDFNMEQITSGIRAQLGELLDLRADDIDLREDRFSHLLAVDDGQGGTRMASRSEIGKWGRNQREFKTSDAGRSLSTRLISNLASAFGRI